MNYRFIFDKKGRKFSCPQCQQKRLVRYVDLKTDDYLPDVYGK